MSQVLQGAKRLFWPSLLLIAIAQLPSVCAVATSAGSSSTSSYEAFRAKFRSKQRPEEDSVSYETRLRLFQQRVAEVEAHNSVPGIAWHAEVNKFADYTAIEHKALLGYRRIETGTARTAEAPSSSFLQLRNKFEADTVDWRQRAVESRSYLREQGECGSCWAVAAVGAMEMHSEIAGHGVGRLSYEQLVDCVPNPQHCGGDGGCEGATAELGFLYTSQNKLHLADQYQGYQEGVKAGCRPVKDTTPHYATVQGFVKLVENKVAPVIQILSSSGPVVASVDAGGWSMYGSGIFNSCSRNATVNHAVLLLGYGKGSTETEGGQKYWLIRNSWGPSWGEAGHIRLLRHDSDEGEAGYCGW
eukprot:CAMPEP_0178425600 /NCGR_PEP_ID=MMETSP0689_2-20121128/28806_1 /TAXON_ID=160604 /ORGANISM="Amphidinium massartii, Strain CS-259" /LENGTH=357 /DNA_ID=CAMNT_0020047267 /DNA_START=53 /DNA_END=1123 /DNA_ORIENTATION=-